MSKKTKPFTAEALAAAEIQRTQAEQRLADLELAFEHGGRTQDAFQRIEAARSERDFHAKVHALAQAEHAAYEREESARVSAELEAKRVADLALVESQLAENIAESIEAGQKLIRGMARGWDLTIAASALGRTGPNAWQHEVSEALFRSCREAGLPARAVHV